MKTIPTAIIIVLTLLLAVTTQLNAEQQMHGSPWVDTETNLYKLIIDGYKVVGNSLSTGMGGLMEFPTTL